MTVFLATSALAQSIVVDAPRPGANILLTSTNLTVQIERPIRATLLPLRYPPLTYDPALIICDAVEGCEPGAQLLYNGPYTRLRGARLAQTATNSSIFPFTAIPFLATSLPDFPPSTTNWLIHDILLHLRFLTLRRRVDACPGMAS
ncbi:hypothetical protein C8J57DRAFT_1520407 [Mycena rebaudengoi]|nr:hypothetical protein C8J57DRAFT_1520407 [Mycena rebaudengoi]